MWVQMTKTSIAAVLGGSLLLAGCVASPEFYATEPVQIQTPGGIVTCQLYTESRVIWDRSVARPETMTVQQADNYCRGEGQRRLRR